MNCTNPPDAAASQTLTTASSISAATRPARSIDLASTPPIHNLQDLPAAVEPPGTGSLVQRQPRRHRSIERYVPPALRSLPPAAKPADEASAATRKLQAFVGGLHQNAHLDTDICEMAARIVSHAFCGASREPWLDSSLETLTQALRQSHSPQQETVYTVCLASMGHTFSILRVGNKALVLQAWMGSYTLGEWVRNTKPSIAGNAWLPAKGAHDAVRIADTMSELSQLLIHAEEKELFDWISKVFTPHPRQFRAIKPAIEKTRSRHRGLVLQWSRLCTPESPLNSAELPPLSEDAELALKKMVPEAMAWTCDAKGNTPLHRLLAQEKFDAAFELIELLSKEYLEQVNRDGDSALHHAAAVRSIALMTALTAKQCTWREVNAKGESPLHPLLHPKAWLKMTPEEVTSIVDLAIQGKANLDSRETGQGHGLLMRLVDHCHDAALLARLIEAGSDVNIQDKRYRTPLMCAAGSGNADAVDLLMAAGAQPKITDKDGDTARDYALTAADMNMVRRLRGRPLTNPTG